MRIYTKTGDEGETGLFGGGRVPKHAVRIAAYGEVDELNSVLGWCAVAADAAQAEILHREQRNLFTLGSFLATPPEAREGAKAYLPAWPEEATPALETEVDQWQEALPELTAFILPGGTELAARLHLARTVCRRAERQLVALAQEGEDQVDAAHVRYLNRLSDWLFVLARYANHLANTPDVPWDPKA